MATINCTLNNFSEIPVFKVFSVGLAMNLNILKKIFSVGKYLHDAKNATIKPYTMVTTTTPKKEWGP